MLVSTCIFIYIISSMHGKCIERIRSFRVKTGMKTMGMK